MAKHDDDSGAAGRSSGSEAVPLHVSPAECCRMLAERVEGDLDGLVEAILAAVRDAAPGYRNLSGDALEAVRFGVTRTASLLLRTLREGRGLSAGEVEVLEAVGEQRAHQGVPLEGLHAATSAANAAGFEYLYDELAVLTEEWSPRRVDVWAASRHLALHAQEFRTAQWAAFERGYHRPDAVRAAEARRDFLASLLAGDFDSDEQVAVAARRCASTLEAPAALLVVAPLGRDPADPAARDDGGVVGERDLRARVVTLTPVVALGLVAPTVADPHPHVVAVVPLRERTWDEVVATLTPRLEEAGLVAVAEPVAALVELAGVYRGLRRRLGVLERFRPRGRVLRAFDLALVWAASQPDDDARFLDVDAVVGPALARRHDRARRDLEALTALRDTRGNWAATARRLGVGTKEVRRKLRQIESRCGLDLANPVDVASLGWALSLYWADPDSLPPPGDPAWGRARRAERAASDRENR